MALKSRRTVVRFYFSFNDPYSFLIMPGVKQLGHDFKIDIDYVPLASFDHTTLFSANEATRNYWRADVARFARRADRVLKYGDEVCDPGPAIRAKFFADEEMLGFKAINLALAHRWVSGADIGDGDGLRAALKFLEMDDKKLRAALTGATGSYADKAQEAEAMAKNEGVLGVPFFTLEGEGFFGADRLDYLIEKLQADPSLVVHHDASYGVIKEDELAQKCERGDECLILDIRIPKSFGAAHIPGSNCLASKIVHRNSDRLDRDQTIILVDDGGVEASEIGFFLAGEGFKNVYTLVDGFPAWKGPTESGLQSWQDKLKPLSR